MNMGKNKKVILVTFIILILIKSISEVKKLKSVKILKKFQYILLEIRIYSRLEL